MKDMFQTSEALKDYDSKKIFVKINASNKVIKKCLCQDLRRKVISYYSRKLTSIKQNYTIEDKKMLVIVSTL